MSKKMFMLITCKKYPSSSKSYILFLCPPPQISRRPSFHPKMLCHTRSKRIWPTVMTIYKNVVVDHLVISIGLVIAHDVAKICHFQSRISVGASVSYGQISSFILCQLFKLWPQGTHRVSSDLTSISLYREKLKCLLVVDHMDQNYP